ncbi:methyl-accepting chemotaxis protein [Cohnella soli]|uniref:Methyl-accepting chemotaxis protein n=1 Tax=Cohnella soli TaxID=425005 RepID=A0ABW0I181_9BACL
MNRWMKRQSLIVSCSIVLSILLVAIISIISAIMYNSTHSEVYRKFTNVGNKLTDVAQANVNLVEKTAPVMAAGQQPPEEQMSILKRLLSGTTDDYLVTNAYYLLSEFRQEGEKNYFKYLQTSESMKKLDMMAGTEYEDHGSFSQVYKEALQGKAGLTDVFKDDYGYWLTFLAPIKDGNGKVVALYGVDFDYRLVKERLDALIWKTVGISAAAVLFSILAVVFLLRAALKPLQLLAARAKEAAKGDLTVSVPVTNENEVGQAATAFNDMVANLRQLTLHIGQTSGEVSSSSFHLKETASQTEAATNEIAHAISRVAVGAESQLASSNECQRAMTEMAIGIQRIAESSSVVSELATGTANLATDGEGVMELTVKQMDTIEQHVSEATQAMRELNESSERIGDILSHIAEVANQTNLLALNASIEAARAGEHGKGFAVVAHEIRKLAERSKTSSEEIATILHEIGERSHVVASSLNVSADEAREGTKLANASGESFRAILGSVKQVSNQVQEVSAAAEQMSAGSEQIAASLGELERTAQVSAANAQEVAAASEEQLASVEEVAGASQQLSTLATQLNEAVSRFKV